MGRRKKREEAPLSLFSFQDIMACLTGILILVALLIAMDGLTDEMEATPGKSGVPNPEVAAARVPVLREQIAILQRSIDDRKGGRDVTKAEVDLLDYSIKDKAMLMERARKRLPRIVAAALLMGVLLLAGAWALKGNYAENAGFLAAAWGLAVLVSGGVVSYFVLAHVTGAMRLSEFKSMLKR